MAVLNTTLAAINTRGHDRYMDSRGISWSRNNEDELKVGRGEECELNMMLLLPFDSQVGNSAFAKVRQLRFRRLKNHFHGRCGAELSHKTSFANKIVDIETLVENVEVIAWLSRTVARLSTVSVRRTFELLN
jgi:hypothetical protein